MKNITEVNAFCSKTTYMFVQMTINFAESKVIECAYVNTLLQPQGCIETIIVLVMLWYVQFDSLKEI